MKLKFTRKTWYFFLLAAAAMSMLGGFAVLGGMDFSGLELIVFCITGIAVLFLAAQKGAPAKDKRSYTLVFVLLMLSKLAAGGWAGDLLGTGVAGPACHRVRPRQAHPAPAAAGVHFGGAAAFVLAADEVCGHERPCLLDEHHVRAAGLRPWLGSACAV